MNTSCPAQPGLRSPIKPWELQLLSPHWARLTGMRLHQSQICRMQHWWILTALTESLFVTKTSLGWVLTGVRGSFWNGTGQILEAGNGIITIGMGSLSLGSVGSGLGPFFLLHNTSCLVSAFNTLQNFPGFCKTEHRQEQRGRRWGLTGVPGPVGVPRGCLGVGGTAGNQGSGSQRTRDKL